MYIEVFCRVCRLNCTVYDVHGIIIIIMHVPLDGKPGSAKRRRKSTSSSLALGKGGSPSTFNPAAMTERQQMAYLLQMTDPQKKAGKKTM